MSKLLLVSASPLIKRLVQKYLPQYELTVETHAVPALQLIRAHQFDVVLLGDSIEHGSALTMLETLNKEAQESLQQGQQQWYPLIYIQSTADSETAIQVLQNGVHEVIDLGQVDAKTILISLKKVQGTYELYRENLRMQHELRRSHSELSQFAAVVSHDLKEPLRKITSFGTLLHDELQQRNLSEQEAHYLNRMMVSAERMSVLLSSLLEVTRITSVPKVEEWNSVQEGLQSAIEVLEQRIVETNTQIEIEGEFPKVQCASFMLVQLFQNLIGNSIKYAHSERNPKISIRCTAVQNAGAVIEIKDNGIGFAPEHSQAIFGIFRRLHARNSHYEGHGVGLAICLRIVEKMGGTLNAEGILGEGAVFKIHLPKAIVDNDTKIDK